ncbi:hypothetical protein [Lactobacillus plantarum subsp. plantarum] [Lactiplantibacillus mudanjiangensis]|uniref:hypothetical protein n=1 Tax=Lactiplantibacillus mudanjiangensis TaxID=1296538 RepID=UPI00101524CC|nr:hypothetical protein [Lactiplantibacillus mudanjiangensis]VDG32868.1 hypothetical protein [Lactobacillus plantarum subsp. plantarum] [Lactiplantibacillus mudanjiangensis]
MSKTKSINVMGVPYKIFFDSTDSRLEYANADAITDSTTKEIHVAKFEDSPNSVANLQTYSQKVLYHEVLHAFLYESGLDSNSDWARNEEIIDWFALQHEKIDSALSQTK